MIPRRLVDQSISWVLKGRSGAWSPDGESIAYRIDGDGGPELWTVGPDGTGARKRLEGVSEFDWYRNMPGSGRREVPCAIQSRCGGCPWMPLRETEQREAKTRYLRDSLKRLGRFHQPPLEPSAWLQVFAVTYFTPCRN